MFASHILREKLVHIRQTFCQKYCGFFVISTFDRKKYLQTFPHGGTILHSKLLYDIQISSFCVGGRVKNENLVLSNELIKGQITTVKDLRHRCTTLIILNFEAPYREIELFTSELQR